jgi:hypothetical protein
MCGPEELFQGNQKNKPKGMIYMNYTIADFRFGESLKHEQPFFMAIDATTLYGSVDDLTSIVSRLGNQVRRFRRQQQIEAIRNDSH